MYICYDNKMSKTMKTNFFCHPEARTERTVESELTEANKKDINLRCNYWISKAESTSVGDPPAAPRTLCIPMQYYASLIYNSMKINDHEKQTLHFF